MEARQREWSFETLGEDRARLNGSQSNFFAMIIFWSCGWAKRISLAVFLAWLVYSGVAAEPRIDKIELFGTNQILLHFNTDANKKYELQYIDRLTCGPATMTTDDPVCGGNAIDGGRWSNLFAVPAIPFANHYVIVDTRTNTHRFYRLRVTS